MILKVIKWEPVYQAFLLLPLSQCGLSNPAARHTQAQTCLTHTNRTISSKKLNVSMHWAWSAMLWSVENDRCRFQLLPVDQVYQTDQAVPYDPEDSNRQSREDFNQRQYDWDIAEVTNAEIHKIQEAFTLGPLGPIFPFRPRGPLWPLGVRKGMIQTGKATSNTYIQWMLIQALQ